MRFDHPAQLEFNSRIQIFVVICSALRNHKQAGYGACNLHFPTLVKVLFLQLAVRRVRCNVANPVLVALFFPAHWFRTPPPPSLLLLLPSSLFALVSVLL